MKKIFFYFVLLAAAVIATVSCSKEEPAPTETTQTGMVLHATVDQTAATRATLSDGDTWTFAFSQNDVVFVRNDEMSHDKHWMFTKGAGDFTCPSAETTKSATDWYAYFPQVIVYLFQQSGKKEDVANLYALSGTTAGPTTGEDGLSIAMAPQVAILVIENKIGPIDINVKTGPNSWVHSLKAKTGSAGFDLVTEETKVSLLTTETPGLYYIAVPAGVQLCIKNGDRELRTTTTAGYTAGKYYELNSDPSFTVTFDENGHGKVLTASCEVRYGSTIDMPNNPFAVGYEFAGWYKDEDCTTLWNFDTDVVTDDITLYAAWNELPASGALFGKFSVSDTKQVYFSMGNLYCSGVEFNMDGFANTHVATWGFEAHQYDTTPSIDGDWVPDHISHFMWNISEERAVDKQYLWWGDGQTLFTNADETTPNPNFTVNGQKGIWRGWSIGEWDYLINRKDGTLYKSGVTVCDHTNCLILLPDDWRWDANTVGTGWQTEYSESTTVTWSSMESAGAVCLPAAGYRDGSSSGLLSSSPIVLGVGFDGRYWSSSPYDGGNAFDLWFIDHIMLYRGTIMCEYDPFSGAFSVRLVTDVVTE